MIENKIAKSGLLTIDLETFRDKREIVSFDLRDYLHMELILKEKDYREVLSDYNWESLKGKVVAAFCSTDAIIAHWAWMLVCAHAHEHADAVIFGTPSEVRNRLLLENIAAHDWNQYEGKRILLKGCSQEALTPAAYAEATRWLLPVAERLMYGEACSFVPVHRRPKKQPA
jgi:hypothetical protein